MFIEITKKNISIGIICFGIGLIIDAYTFHKSNMTDLFYGFITGPITILFGVLIYFIESKKK